MIKNLKKKKAFTLVEVIIVLAIIAIIAAIAIPNLTKVRQESKIKADNQSLETIERTINMLITDETIPSATELTISISDGKNVTVSGPKGDTTADYASVASEIVEYLDGIRKPQEEGKHIYEVKIASDGVITSQTIKETETDK